MTGLICGWIGGWMGQMYGWMKKILFMYYIHFHKSIEMVG